jgi:hypothetical protein
VNPWFPRDPPPSRLCSSHPTVASRPAKPASGRDGTPTRDRPLHWLLPRARSSGDRARASGARGRRFDSCRAHQPPHGSPEPAWLRVPAVPRSQKRTSRAGPVLDRSVTEPVNDGSPSSGQIASAIAPYRWSQRWHDDPPIGTIVFGHERVIYLGNGEWQRLADMPND